MCPLGPRNPSHSNLIIPVYARRKLPLDTVCEANLEDASDADDVVGETGTHDAQHLVRSCRGRPNTDDCALSGAMCGEAVAAVKPLECSCNGNVLKDACTSV